MKRVSAIILLLVMAISCKNQKKEELVLYNDRVVNIVEEADMVMKTWQHSDLMVNYDSSRAMASGKVNMLQDSLKLLLPVNEDDTLRLSGIALLSGYLQTFTIYDTIYRILNDSLYMQEDSIRVHTLLMTNKNLLDQQTVSFAEVQKRFATRYELNFMQ
jgi:hypothetical protein